MPRTAPSPGRAARGYGPGQATERACAGAAPPEVTSPGGTGPPRRRRSARVPPRYRSRSAKAVPASHTQRYQRATRRSRRGHGRQQVPGPGGAATAGPGDAVEQRGAGTGWRTAWGQAVAIFDDLAHPGAQQVRDRLAGAPA